MINVLIRVQVRSREGRMEWGTAGEEEQPLPPAASPMASGPFLLKTADTLPWLSPSHHQKIQPKNCSLNVMPQDDKGGGLTLYVTQYWSPSQIFTENRDTFHQEFEVFLWRSTREGLRMPEEELGGTIKLFFPLLLPRGMVSPKLGWKEQEGGGRREERERARQGWL